jgi:hypothetical protein
MRPCGMARPGVGLSGHRCAAERRREARLWLVHHEVSSTSLGERSDSDSGSLSPPPDPPGLASPSSTSHAVFLLVMCSRSCSRPKDSCRERSRQPPAVPRGFFRGLSLLPLLEWRREGSVVSGGGHFQRTTRTNLLSGDQVSRENPASRGTEASAEVLYLLTYSITSQI